ncbi:MAG: hypothetical protein AABX66_02555 [Nanoarchaeota archaeon]
MRGLRYILASLVAVFALTFLFYSLVPVKTTGFNVAKTGEASFGNGFRVYNPNFEVKSGVASVEYYIQELSGKNREINIYYEVYDVNGVVYSSGDSKIVVGANENKKYLLSFPFSDYYRGTFLIRASDGKESSISSVFLNDKDITSNVIMESPSRLFGGFGVFLVILILLFYFVRNIHRRTNYKRFAKERHNSRFINLDI